MSVCWRSASAKLVLSWARRNIDVNPTQEEIDMNFAKLGLIAMVIAATSAHANTRAVNDYAATATMPASSVVIACASTQAPKLDDVAELVGTRHDRWQSYVARQRLLALAKPVCARGIDLVQFVSAG
jgi:hypothetical protein